MPRPRRLAALLRCALWIGLNTAAAHAAGAVFTDSAALVAQGAPGVPPCAACHGAAGQGGSAASPQVPRLAGLPAPYLLRQLREMATGTRQSAVMSPIARALTGAQQRALAKYFATLPDPGSAPGAPASGASVSALAKSGQALAEHGRWSQGLPACALCHGDRGTGVGNAFPPLAGQSSAYLADQLHDFKDGARAPGPLGLMKVVASKLSERDIAAVAAYFSSQSSQPGAVSSPVLDAGSLADLPDDEFGEVVRQGERIFEDPARYAAPYVGNQLRCSNCHLDAGRLAHSAPLWAAYVSYPAYRSKNHRVSTFAERLQGCFRFSMNGKAPPLGDPVLVALESYSYWLARGRRVDPHIAGRGYPKLPKPVRTADYGRGRRVYAEQCALCHGADGAGQSAADGNVVFPPLWGPESFNWGAGMASVQTAAAFIEANMPLGRSETLSDQQAWDVALFIDSHERPQDPRFDGSVAQTRKRYHDSSQSMYGKVVNGHLLGSERIRAHGLTQ